MFPTFQRRQHDRRAIARAVSDLRTAIASPSAGQEQRTLHAAKHVRSLLSGVSRALDSNLDAVVKLAEHVIRTQNSGWVQKMAREMLSSGHPIGTILASTMLAKRDAQLGKQMETQLRKAAEILKQISPELFGDGSPQKPEDVGGRRIKDVPPPNVLRNDKPLPAGVEYLGNGFVRVKGNGFIRFYKETDPIITGQMIKVSSSNVHSIGFRLNTKDPQTSLLLVRYLQADGGYTGGPASKNLVPGPTYGYKGVHPDLFTEFRKAISKGIFVWDNLRMRGTIHGHQYPYFLANIAQGYMPRKAKLINGQTWFKTRKNVAILGGGRIKAVQSRLPEQRVGRGRTINRRPTTGMR